MNGSSRIRTPVAAKMAFPIAGATTSTGISETLFAPNGPVGSSVVTRIAFTGGVSTDEKIL